MGGKREYTAIFAVGAKLLGSFRSAMTAAQSRLRSLQAATHRVGSSILKLGAIFSGVFAGFATFLAANVFSKIFSGASEEAIAAEQRTRSLLASLMLLNAVRKGGEASAQKQLALIYRHNEALEAQGVLSKKLLDTMAVQLAAQKLPPKQIQDTIDVMQNLLVKQKGVTATTEDAAQMSMLWGRAVTRGVVRGMGLGISMTDRQAKAFKKLSVPERAAELVRLGKAIGNLSKEARATPAGRIALFNNALEKTRLEIGQKLLPAQAAMADAWRAALPEIAPLLISGMKLLLSLVTQLGNAVRTRLIPWWKEFQKSDRFKQIQSVFAWMQQHAKGLAIAFGVLAVAAVGLNVVVGVVGALVALATPVGAFVAIVLALAAGFAALYTWWDKLKSMPVLGTILKGYEASFRVMITLLNALGATIHAVIYGDWKNAGEAMKTLWKEIVGLFDWGKDIIANVFKFIGNAAQQYFVKVLENAKTLWEYFTHPSKIIGAFKGLPSAAQLSGAPAGAGYQRGGIISRPTLAMMGERGSEAVIPLSGGARSESLLGYASRALGKGSPAATVVNYTSNVTINGPATESQQHALVTKLRSVAREFVTDFKQAQLHERRLSYEGGYS